jgi:hypothetical protein
MTTKTETKHAAALPPCPAWCDPAQHSDDPESDGTATHYHRSADVEVPGWASAQVVQTVKASSAGPVSISVSPGGWAELESYAEARAYQGAIDEAMHRLISIAWPQDRLSEIRAIAAGILDEVLQQYIELFQAELAGRQSLAGAK